MALSDLPPQPPISAEVEAYAAFCVKQTTQVLETIRHILDIANGVDYRQKLKTCRPTSRRRICRRSCLCMVATGATATKSSLGLWPRFRCRSPRFLCRLTIV